MEAEPNTQERRELLTPDVNSPQEVAPTLGDHVQDVLKGIMDFIRGRDASEHEHDHER